MVYPNTILISNQWWFTDTMVPENNKNNKDHFSKEFRTQTIDTRTRIEKW